MGDSSHESSCQGSPVSENCQTTSISNEIENVYTVSNVVKDETDQSSGDESTTEGSNQTPPATPKNQSESISKEFEQVDTDISFRRRAVPGLKSTPLQDLED